jgi:hypothetical protein
MGQLHQGQNVLLLAVFSNHRDPGGLAAGVNLDSYRLCDATGTVFQPDCERIRTHHHSPTTAEQKPCALFGARH